jgi:hypothetical protein
MAVSPSKIWAVTAADAMSPWAAGSYEVGSPDEMDTSSFAAAHRPVGASHSAATATAIEAPTVRIEPTTRRRSRRLTEAAEGDDWAIEAAARSDIGTGV